MRYMNKPPIRDSEVAITGNPLISFFLWVLENKKSFNPAKLR